MKFIIGHCFLTTQSNNWLRGENLSFQTRKGRGFHKHTTSAIMPLFTSEAYYVKILLSELIWHVLLRGSINFCICITRFLHFWIIWLESIEHGYISSIKFHSYQQMPS